MTERELQVVNERKLMERRREEDRKRRDDDDASQRLMQQQAQASADLAMGTALGVAFGE